MTPARICASVPDIRSITRAFVDCLVVTGLLLFSCPGWAQSSSAAQSPGALAESYLQAGRYSDAVALLAPIARTQRNDPALELLLGKALIGAGRLPEGAAVVEKAAAQASSPEAYLLAGQTRFGMGQYDLARQDAQAVQRLNGKLAHLATLRGMILEQTSDYPGAKAALLQAVTEDPDDFNAHFYLGGLFYFLRDMRQAKTHLLHALELDPDSAQARYELALVEYADGNLNESLKELQLVIEQLPGWIQPHVELSSLFYRMHRPEDGAKERQIVDRMMAELQKEQADAARYKSGGP